MRNLKVKFICLFFFTLIQSCEKEDCSNVLCAPNSTFKFELVNANRENLLSNNTIQINDIKIIDLDNENTVEFTLTSENGNDLIVINSIDMSIGTINYIVQVSEIDIFGLFIINVRSIGECCDVTTFSELRVLDSEFLFDETTEVYTFTIV